MNQWLNRAHAHPERVFAYGSDKLRGLGARVNAGRRRALVGQRAKHPELQAVYDAKIADIDSFVAEAASDVVVAALHERGERALDAANQTLAEHAFLVADADSLADLMWTVTLAWQMLLGGAPLAERPALAAWYARMRARPSFVAADIWEATKPLMMVPVVRAKFPWVVLLVAATSAGVTYGLYRILSGMLG